MNRYEHQCEILKNLSQHQLNLPKNKVKGDFEDLKLSQIIALISQEHYELFEEVSKLLELQIFDPENLVERGKLKIRIMEEIGDVAACLTGLIAKIGEI